MVIRIDKSFDPNGQLYDYDLPEHMIFISDWLHLDADQRFPGLLTNSPGQDADSYLINGHGRTTVSTGTHMINLFPFSTHIYSLSLSLSLYIYRYIYISGVANLRLFEGLFVALDKSKYPELKKAAYRIISIFGTTYLYESFYSTVKFEKIQTPISIN